MELTLAAVLLGLLNVAVVVALLLLVGLIIWWVFTSPQILGLNLDSRIQRLYIALVVIIAIYMVVALLFGMPTWHPLARIGG